VRAYLGLGANLGDPRAQLAAAVRALSAHDRVRVVAVSSLYRTAPVGGRAQPDYYNAAVVLETGLDARALAALGQELERQAGRARTHERDAPRTLDVDLLLFGGERIADADLTVPHPRLAERAFALLPLAEVAPDARHPGSGRTVAELAAEVSSAGVERLAGAWLHLR
jgi:2-amino-4-hydroxy-6-hydroxymethyldihydropteridine diphosphokinase